MSENEKRMTKALKEIQDRCAEYYHPKLTDEGKFKIIQDIWREANFAIIDVKNAHTKL